MTNFKLSSDKSTLVNPEIFWIPITDEHKPPLGTKLLLVNDKAGVAQLGQYKPDGWYTHYYPLPKFKV